MAYFHSVPDGRSISNTEITVQGTSITVGLADAGDLQVTNAGDGLSIFPAGKRGNSALYTIQVNERTRSTQSAGYADTVIATNNLGAAPATTFKVTFNFKVEPATRLVVRDRTQELFGVAQFHFQLAPPRLVDMTTFRPGDQSHVLDFAIKSARVVSLSLFSAKIGITERAFWLMLPEGTRATSLMVVISHGFGQNHAYYSGKGYGDPLSKDLLADVRDRFVLARWGMQVAAVRSDMGLLFPVRAHTGGTELGPFISEGGVGAAIISTIAAQANADFLLNAVDVCTFSSGIHDANTFIATGGKGLNYRLMVNQDPAGGVPIAGKSRRQYLSGWTTGGPRPGFEFLPKPRWVKDPKFDEMNRALGREYLHTWALPTYTLAMALSQM